MPEQSLIFAFEFRTLVAGTESVYCDFSLAGRPIAEGALQTLDALVAERGSEGNRLVAYAADGMKPVMMAWLRSKGVAGRHFREDRIIFVAGSRERLYQYERIGANVVIDSSLTMMKGASWPSLIRRIIVSGVKNDRRHFEHLGAGCREEGLFFHDRWEHVSLCLRRF